jgi:hypothetical protein
MMYSDQDLQDAVQHGVISQDAVQAFKAFITDRKQVSLVDEESFRLLTGFNDVFVVIACIMLMVAAGWIGGALLGSAFIAVIAWFLSEIFIRKRQMALPAIVLFAAFTAATGVTASTWYGALMSYAGADANPAEKIQQFMGLYKGGALFGFAVAVFAACLHWYRFRVPIAVAGGVAALIIFVLSLFAKHISGDALLGLFFFAGLNVFLFAMWWDLRDPLRQTRRTDVAFWLHLLAAPLLVHPVFMLLDFSNTPSGVWWQVVVVVALYGLIGIVSLCIDRRALMVSALAYVLYAFAELFKQSGVVELSFAVAAFIVACALLTLSVFWHRSRVFVLQFLPDNLRNRLASTL